jgi:hypothetical protein
MVSSCRSTLYAYRLGTPLTARRAEFMAHQENVPVVITDDTRYAAGELGMHEPQEPPLERLSEPPTCMTCRMCRRRRSSSIRGLTLLRHIDRDDTLLDRPTFPWTTRSAVRTAGACVGIFAAFIARRIRDSTAVGPFLGYANAHMKRSRSCSISSASRHLSRGCKPP